MGTVLIIDDEQLVRWSIEKLLSKDGHEIISADTGAAGLLKLKDSTPDIVLLDMKLPDIDGIEVLRTIKKDTPELPVVIITAYGSIDSAIDAIKNGAFDYIVKPFDAEKLKLTVNRALELFKLKTELEIFKDKAHNQYGFHRIVAESTAVKQAIDIAKKLAMSDTTVLIQGESGTGKELFARAIHCASPRQDRAFVDLNCSAIPVHLIESELFGYEKGAFTDAKTSKKGLFELADKGTLFLDEIGDMDLSTQAKLLRVIETKSFKRLGGTKDITVDVRIISATNKDLKKLVEKGAFRDDLYYRINVVPLVIPPLRKRKDDIPLLVNYFINVISKDLKKEVTGIEKEALDYLIRYDWPGNVRELKNVVERMILLTNTKVLTKEFIPI
ncbi:MAG: sigma-54-dependent transcriptional regulator, partial [bacterium]